jgi:hypothetical protein
MNAEMAAGPVGRFYSRQWRYFTNRAQDIEKRR